MSVYLSVCLSVSHSLSPSLYLSLSLPLSLPACLPACLSVCLSVCLCLCLCLSVCLSVCLSLFLSLSLPQSLPPSLPPSLSLSLSLFRWRITALVNTMLFYPFHSINLTARTWHVIAVDQLFAFVQYWPNLHRRFLFCVLFTHATVACYRRGRVQLEQRQLSAKVCQRGWIIQLWMLLWLQTQRWPRQLFTEYVFLK